MGWFKKLDLVGTADHLLGAAPHPDALRLFAAHREIDADDIERAAVVGDRGHDAAFDYRERRAEVLAMGIGRYLRETAAGWDVPTVYSEELSREESVRSFSEQEELSGVDFEQAVWVLDVTIAATAFCHLLLHGKLDREAKEIVAIALRRRLHPLVLETLEAEPSAKRTKSVERMASLFASAPEA